MRMKNIYISVAVLLNCTTLFSQTEKLVEYLTVPGYKEYSKIDLQQHTILPSGRYIRPAGTTLRITHDPFGMAISPDQRVAVTLHENVFSIIQTSVCPCQKLHKYSHYCFQNKSTKNLRTFGFQRV